MKDLKRICPSNTCGGVLCIAARIPGVFICATGPRSCLRMLFYRLYQEQLHEKLVAVAFSDTDFSLGLQGRLVEDALEKLLPLNPRAILIYSSCSDLLAAMDYGSLAAAFEEKHGVPTAALERGPLSSRSSTTKERLMLLLDQWATQIPGFLPGEV